MIHNLDPMYVLGDRLRDGRFEIVDPFLDPGSFGVEPGLDPQNLHPSLVGDRRVRQIRSKIYGSPTTNDVYATLCYAIPGSLVGSNRLFQEASTMHPKVYMAPWRI